MSLFSGISTQFGSSSVFNKSESTKKPSAELAKDIIFRYSNQPDDAKQEFLATEIRKAINTKVTHSTQGKSTEAAKEKLFKELRANTNSLISADRDGFLARLTTLETTALNPETALHAGAVVVPDRSALNWVTPLQIHTQTPEMKLFEAADRCLKLVGIQSDFEVRTQLITDLKLLASTEFGSIEPPTTHPSTQSSHLQRDVERYLDHNDQPHNLKFQLLGNLMRQASSEDMPIMETTKVLKTIASGDFTMDIVSENNAEKADTLPAQNVLSQNYVWSPGGWNTPANLMTRLMIAYVEKGYSQSENPVQELKKAIDWVCLATKMTGPHNPDLLSDLSKTLESTTLPIFTQNQSWVREFKSAMSQALGEIRSLDLQPILSNQEAQATVLSPDSQLHSKPNTTDTITAEKSERFDKTIRSLFDSTPRIGISKIDHLAKSLLIRPQNHLPQNIAIGIKTMEVKLTPDNLDTILDSLKDEVTKQSNRLLKSETTRDFIVQSADQIHSAIEEIRTAAHTLLY